MNAELRRATAADATAVREIVLRALRETNARDYPVSVIDRLVLTLPDKIAARLEEWQAFVALVEGRVVGTGSLDGAIVASVFVHPDFQRRGVGAMLMDALESAAIARGETSLGLQSSVTAQGFYARRGYRTVREDWHEEERTIVMSKVIAAAQILSPPPR